MLADQTKDQREDGGTMALRVETPEGSSTRHRVIVDGELAGYVVQTSVERWYGSRKRGTADDGRKMSYGFHSVERAAQWVAASAHE